MTEPNDIFEKTNRNQVRRVPKRGAYDKQTIYPILDAALICHVGLASQNQPFVIPTIHARHEDNLLLHGATTSRLIQHIQAGHEICVTVTHLDGLVLARSVFHHSMNYRSAVVFGRGHLITGDEAKMAALERFTEKLVPGRWADARQPTPTELKATSIVAIPIESGSAKVRVGPPGDDAADLNLPVWAGVLPIHTQFGNLQPAQALPQGVDVPAYLHEYATAAFPT